MPDLIRSSFLDGSLETRVRDRWAVHEARTRFGQPMAPTLESQEEEDGATDLIGFVKRRNPTLLRYEHIPVAMDVAQRWCDGEIPRLLLCWPPRYFKSEVFSRLVPAYLMRQRHPWKVGVMSYGAQLAWELSDEARTYYEADGGVVSERVGAKRHWKSEDSGQVWADGIGGSLRGKGFTHGIIDDPMNPTRGTISVAAQKEIEGWWPGTLLRRREPGARIAVIMQRLDVNDLIQWLLRREVGADGVDRAPEHWHVVIFDELKSSEPLGEWDGPMGLPPTCTLEPDWRKEGEPLAPSRFSLGEVKHGQLTAGAFVKASQLQQRPTSPTGDFWQEDWFNVYDELPDDAYNGGKDWDLAYTKDDLNSASAYVESYRGPGKRGEFPIYVHDCGTEWFEFPELVKWIAELKGPHYIEGKASGKSAKQTLTREGIKVKEVPVKGDKLARASGVQPIVSQGRVHVRRSILRHFLQDRQGLLRVTAEALAASKGDLDLNDGFVQALWRHTGRKGGRTARAAVIG